MSVEGEINLSLCLTKHHTMKTCLGSGCTAPRSIELRTGWRL